MSLTRAEEEKWRNSVLSLNPPGGQNGRHPDRADDQLCVQQSGQVLKGPQKPGVLRQVRH